MGKLHVSIFSFDSRIDFQNGFVRQDIHYKSNDTLKDVFQAVQAKNFGYQEFGVDMQFIHCRINGYAVLGNIAVKEIVEKVGHCWEIEPLSKRYAKKDLLLNLDMIFARYEGFFHTMDFIVPSEREELGKYLLMNFIVPCQDESYCGDGFLLYVKWLMVRYPLYKEKLLNYIASDRNGIFMHINTANFMLPHNRAIDTQIESLQSMLIAPSRKNQEWIALGVRIASQYHFNCKQRIADYNAAESFAPFIQSIVHAQNGAQANSCW